MTDYVVAKEDELSEGESLIVTVDGKEIGIFNYQGEYYACLNWCLHQGGPICEGTVTGKITATLDENSPSVTLEWTDEDRILSCPWHGWEYDLTTGECFSHHTAKMPTYPVRIEDSNIIVSL